MDLIAINYATLSPLDQMYEIKDVQILQRTSILFVVLYFGAIDQALIYILVSVDKICYPCLRMTYGA